jgi:AI-2E family transporter
VSFIGLPSPFALGVIAGIAEVIPYLGPIIASNPAILVAATKDPYAVIWTVVAYAAIHQMEGNVMTPIIRRHMVFIPPTTILLGIVSISFAFGMGAIILRARQVRAAHGDSWGGPVNTKYSLARIHRQMLNTADLCMFGISAKHSRFSDGDYSLSALLHVMADLRKTPFFCTARSAFSEPPA